METKEASKETKPNAKTLLLHFASQWQERYRCPYAIRWTKDAANAKRLIEIYGYEQLARGIDYYLGLFPSEFCRRANHPFGLFVSSINEVMGGLAKEEEQKNKAGQSDSDYEALMEARRREQK